MQHTSVNVEVCASCRILDSIRILLCVMSDDPELGGYQVIGELALMVGSDIIVYSNG